MENLRALGIELADEAIALTRHRFYISRRIGNIVQGGSQLTHSGIETPIEAHHTPRPQACGQVLAGNQLIRVGDELFQNLKRLVL